MIPREVEQFVLKLVEAGGMSMREVAIAVGITHHVALQIWRRNRSLPWPVPTRRNRTKGALFPKQGHHAEDLS